MLKLTNLVGAIILLTNLACGAKPKSETRPSPAPPAKAQDQDPLALADTLIQKCSIKLDSAMKPEDILITVDTIRRNCNYDEGQIQLMAERIFKN